MATFPAYNALLITPKKVVMRSLIAQFGDGYSQRTGDGINTQHESWDLQFREGTTDIDTIETFLVARGGYELFDWTSPTSTASQKFLCPSWTRKIVTNTVADLSCSFELMYGA